MRWPKSWLHLQLSELSKTGFPWRGAGSPSVQPSTPAVGVWETGATAQDIGVSLTEEDTHRLPPSHQPTCCSCPLSPHNMGGTAPPRPQAALDGGTWPAADPGPPVTGGQLVPLEAVCPSCSPTTQGAGPLPLHALTPLSLSPFPCPPLPQPVLSLSTPTVQLTSTHQVSSPLFCCSLCDIPRMGPGGGGGPVPEIPQKHRSEPLLLPLLLRGGEKKNHK